MRWLRDTLADALMPGHDWAAVRAAGQVPYARGLADRAGMVAALERFAPKAANALARLACRGELGVLVVDHGVACVFGAESGAQS